MKRKLIPRKRIPKGEQGLDTKKVAPYYDPTTGKQYYDIPEGKVQPLTIKGQYVTEKAHDNYYDNNPVWLNNVNIYPTSYEQALNIDPTNTEQNMFRRAEVQAADNYVRGLHPIDNLVNAVVNFWNNGVDYTKNYFGINGEGGTVLLPLNKVNRMTPNDKGYVLFNEFIENNNNTIRQAKDFINTTDTLLGDNKIPLSNISLFQGVENGRFKVGPIESFNSDTYVIPVRNQNKGKVSGIIRKENEVPDKKAISKLLDNIVGPVPGLLKGAFTMSSEERNDYFNRRKSAKNELMKSGKYPTTAQSTINFISENDTIPIDYYGVSNNNKLLLGNEDGNAVFINNINGFSEDQIQQLNEILNNSPMYLDLVDNGRYKHFNTTLKKPVSTYISPLDNGDDMYIIGIK